MLPNHSHSQSHPHLLILSKFVSRFPDQPNQTATQLPTWKCFQKSFAKLKKSSGDQNRTQKSDPKMDFHNGEPLFFGLQSWNSTHELVQKKHQLAPWTWCRAVRSKKSTFQLLCARRRPRLEPTMHPGVIGAWNNDGNGDLQKSQQCVIETINVCKKHDRFFSPFEFTDVHWISPTLSANRLAFRTSILGCHNLPIPSSQLLRLTRGSAPTRLWVLPRGAPAGSKQCEMWTHGVGENDSAIRWKCALCKPPNKMFHTLGR